MKSGIAMIVIMAGTFFAIAALFVVKSGLWESSVFADRNRTFTTCIVPATKPIKEPNLIQANDRDAKCMMTVEVPKGWRCWTDDDHWFDVKDEWKSRIGRVPQPLCKNESASPAVKPDDKSSPHAKKD